MIDIETLLRNFVTDVYDESSGVSDTALFLYREFNLESHFAWMAVKEHILESAAKAGVTPKELSIRWIKAYKDNRLTWTITKYRTLLITEIR